MYHGCEKLFFHTLQHKNKGRQNSRQCAHLALAGDGLVEQQAAAVLLVQAGVLGAQRVLPGAGQAGRPQRLEALGRERRRRRGRVRLVAGARPAPVAARRAVAGGREGPRRAVVLPRAAQALWRRGGGGEKEGGDEDLKGHPAERENVGASFSSPRLDSGGAICTSHGGATAPDVMLLCRSGGGDCGDETLPRPCFCFC